MIRKLKSGKYRLYSRKVDPKTGKLKNLGTFDGMMAHLMDVLSQGEDIGPRFFRFSTLRWASAVTSATRFA
jgi:hypothetical protein